MAVSYTHLDVYKRQTYNNGLNDVPSKQTPVVVVTQDNVKEALIDSGYYSASQFTGIE